MTCLPALIHTHKIMDSADPRIDSLKIGIPIRMTPSPYFHPTRKIIFRELLIIDYHVLLSIG